MKAADHAVIEAEYTDYLRVKGRKVFRIMFEVPLEKAGEVRERLGEPGLHGEKRVAIALLKLDAKEAPKSAKPAAAPEPQKSASGGQSATDPAATANPPPVKPERERQRFENMKPSQQAGLLCADTEFWEWLQECGYYCPDGDDAAIAVRNMCHVSSRSQLDTNDGARNEWGLAVECFTNWRKDRRAEERARQQAKEYAR